MPAVAPKLVEADKIGVLFKRPAAFFCGHTRLPARKVRAGTVGKIIWHSMAINGATGFGIGIFNPCTQPGVVGHITFDGGVSGGFFLTVTFNKRVAVVVGRRRA